MEIVVLGSSAAQPAAGDACSGYLVRSAEGCILLDCGTGVLASLQLHVPITQLDAIVISHMHADHFLDLVPLRYGIKYARTAERPIPVFVPPGGIAQLRALGEHLSQTQPFFDSVFTLCEYVPEAPFRSGPLTVLPVPVRHSIPSFALRVTSNGSRLAYSSDTAPCASLGLVAADADLLIAECALGPDSHLDPEAPRPELHLTAAEAGEAASSAGARRLLLTHFWPGADRDASRTAASRRYAGDVGIAHPGLAFQL